ncbi:MAG TPA: radical SAM/SPASM domain-containing protein, partial [Terriglobia bacterium]|nr:radical SAM/SPASM domain-containing protein [Terriglobia bacterium]
MNFLRRLFSNRPNVLSQRSGTALFEPDIDQMVTPSPKMLWIELTSKCPFKCVFCTREVRWGTGRNLDFDVYSSLIEQLEAPEFIGLNYSGESIHYPRLMEAIKLACATGAYTELVTALSSAPETLVRRIVESDLDRLAVSIHTLDEKQYQNIYGFGSLRALKERIEDVIQAKIRLKKNTPKLDFCFVAMSENLNQLLPVCRYAMEVGASEISIHPVIGRHPVPYDFSRELNSNKLTTQFKESLRRAVAETRAACPGLPITVLNADLEVNPVLRPVPHYYAPSLPAGGRIHTCDQSPFESVHVLANGDVVVCEVHDEVALGNLHSTGLREIWHSDRYRRFRREYVSGMNASCRDCVWKTAYNPEPWKSRIHASDGLSPQLTRGWWVEPGAPAIWSKKRSIAELRIDSPARQLRIEGILPHDPVTHSNSLVISGRGHAFASIGNPTRQFLEFDRTFPLSTAVGNRLVFEFATRQTFRPSAHLDSTD